jgi:tRNA(adenine34) deaminase
MQAITAASNYLGAKYLVDCRLYVTLEPCIMCAGAIYWAQLGELIIGAADSKRGFLREGKHLIHPKTEIRSGVLEDKCSLLVKDFFKGLR